MEFRIKNFMPRGHLIVKGTSPLDADYEDLLRTAVQRVDLDELDSQREQARRRGHYLGFGIALAVEPGGRNLARDLALLPSTQEPAGSGGTS